MILVAKNNAVRFIIHKPLAKVANKTSPDLYTVLIQCVICITSMVSNDFCSFRSTNIETRTAISSARKRPSNQFFSCNAKRYEYNRISFPFDVRFIECVESNIGFVVEELTSQVASSAIQCNMLKVRPFVFHSYASKFRPM